VFSLAEVRRYGVEGHEKHAIDRGMGRNGVMQQEWVEIAGVARLQVKDPMTNGGVEDSVDTYVRIQQHELS
jgi:hypothetical protein